MEYNNYIPLEKMSVRYKYFCFIFHCFILIEYNFYYLNNLCVVQFVKEIIYLIF